jgi:glutathione synthase/RimK-type ligase-like ATP-grasp enzyme
MTSSSVSPFLGLVELSPEDCSPVLEVNGNPGFQAIDQVYSCQTAEKVIAFIEQQGTANAT